MPTPTKRAQLKSLIPAAAGWRTFPRAFISLLVFGLAVVAGEWVVHQLEYLTEYGPRFGDVMATTPHRFYMMPLGIALGLSVAMLLAVACGTLVAHDRFRGRLLSRLPARVARHVPGLTLRVRPSALFGTTVILAVSQATVYVLQENVEGIAITGQWRGLSVLFGSQHATVVPFHLLIAACSALLLWALTSLVSESRGVVRMARTLAAMLASPADAPIIPRARSERVPDLRLLAGELCLRSPPLAA
jgi:hypothetical protein